MNGDRDVRLEALLRASVERDFEPRFADRLMRRIEAEETARLGAPGLYRSLKRAFVPLAAAAGLAAVGLGLANALGADPGLYGSTVEAVLAWPGESLESLLLVATA